MSWFSSKGNCGWSQAIWKLDHLIGHACNVFEAEMVLLLGKINCGKEVKMGEKEELSSSKLKGS